jgi:VWFA-related protein
LKPRLRLAPLAVLLLAWTVSTSSQGPVFSARVEAVRLDVLAADGARPIPGLTAADFEILDNGVRQTIDDISVDQIPLNLLLTLDMSDSVAGDDLQRLRDAGHTVLDGLRAGDRAALLTFGDALSLRSRLTGDLAQVRRGLSAGAGAGRTALADAAYATMWLSEGDPGRALAIVFSDGMDTASLLSADRVIDGAKRADMVVYGVATSSIGDGDFLSQLSTTTGGRVFAITSAGALSATFATILDEFRQRYVISYTPKGVAKGGWHRLEVRVKNRRARVTTRTGYLSGPS